MAPSDHLAGVLLPSGECSQISGRGTDATNKAISNNTAITAT
eukprot:CAMPEP_0204192222 /NCGR_PEP_ID=MMETSP0361-20130328/60704_1 /ASSEMBLY_ACC=CAM_ASM_000343 /TAXON_ID=268821 /ORGANISM="Scrippsiella Hangoei, Strain SHTV-5" /LENGTH=41 /DNA_ID= /DNA_START= /DNA_END= /DNA_ORIENTATION=